jgi:transcriptional regulator with XRE-family HTH domain
MNTLGERLKLLRTGHSQQSVAERFGIPQTTWSNYEKGKNEPDFAFINKVCLEFRVSADWLLFGHGPRESDHYADLEYRKIAEELIRTQRMLIEAQQEKIADLKSKP